PVVDGDAEDVPGEVGEHDVDAMLGLVDVNDPGLVPEGLEPLRWLHPGLREGALNRVDEGVAESLGEALVGREKGDVSPLAILVDDAGRYEAVYMRMIGEGARPCVEHGHDADLALGALELGAEVDERAA